LLGWHGNSKVHDVPSFISNSTHICKTVERLHSLSKYVLSFNSVYRRQASNLHNAPPRQLVRHTSYRHQQLYRHSDWMKNVGRPGKRRRDQHPRRRKEPAGIMIDKCFKHTLHNIRE